MASLKKQVIEDLEGGAMLSTQNEAQPSFNKNDNQFENKNEGKSDKEENSDLKDKVKKIKKIVTITKIVIRVVAGIILIALSFIMFLISIMITIFGPFIPSLVTGAAIVSTLTGAGNGGTNVPQEYMISISKLDESDDEKLSLAKSINAAIAAPIDFFINNTNDFPTEKDKLGKESCILFFSGLKKDSGSSYYEDYMYGSNIENLEEAINQKCSNVVLKITDIFEEIYEKKEYKFDKDEYQKFLSDFYINPYLNKIVEGYADDNNITIEEAQREIINGITDYYKLYLKTNVNDNNVNDYLTVVDTLSPVYGNAKCILLEKYEPLDHEYIITQAQESSNIYSASDGKVISIIYGSNLYDNYDYKTNKCLCNGVKCDKYNGSEIVIEFNYDNVKYFATYSNLNEIFVEVGNTVKKGDLIATEGDTGCTNHHKLTFNLKSDNGVNYNTNELMQRCSSVTATEKACDFQFLTVNIYDCNNNIVATTDFYTYIKELVYRNYKVINNKEVTKAILIATATKVLHDNKYVVGSNKLDIKDCNYSKIIITASESKKLNQSINEIIGQVMTYNAEFANTKYSLSCKRTEKDHLANSVYNELCIVEALKTANDYEKILNIYFPNYKLNKNYCLNYAKKVNKYEINNEKEILKNSYNLNQIEKLNANLKSDIEFAGYGTRAATVEAARFLALGLKNKIPYNNGGKYMYEGINRNWFKDGLDSSGFVSWALFNGKANISNNMNIKELITTNIVGKIEIDTNLYEQFDKIQVGDFAYGNSKIGLIIGKEEGTLYVASVESNEGLIVTTITSYGEAALNFTDVYLANDYYNGIGNLNNMW